jgi:UMP-CMP kinase
MRQQTSSRYSYRQQQQRFYSEPPKTGNTSKVKFWPFLALIGVTSAGYMGLVNRRKGELRLCAEHARLSSQV